MSWNHNELPRRDSTRTNTSSKYSYFNLIKKPVEIYVFIDPLCPECWALEPYLKKLEVEFGRFFTLRPIISSNLYPLDKGAFDRPKKLHEIWEKTAKRTGMSCDGDLWLENPIQSSWIISLAIKAAELQGKRAGRRFLRKVQEYLFLKKKDISEESILIECAEEINLDLDEFKNDLFSSTAKKALQCDLKLLEEMDVDYVPTIVFFNQLTNEDGIKISGLYPYDIYIQVLYDLLRQEVEPANKPPLEDFLAFHKVVACKEVAVVYDWPLSKAKKEMKKLQLKQIAREISVKYGSFWKFIGET